MFTTLRRDDPVEVCVVVTTGAEREEHSLESETRLPFISRFQISKKRNRRIKTTAKIDTLRISKTGNSRKPGSLFWPRVKVCIIRAKSTGQARIQKERSSVSSLLKHLPLAWCHSDERVNDVLSLLWCQIRPHRDVIRDGADDAASPQPPVGLNREKGENV